MYLTKNKTPDSRYTAASPTIIGKDSRGIETVIVNAVPADVSLSYASLKEYKAAHGQKALNVMLVERSIDDMMEHFLGIYAPCETILAQRAKVLTVA